MQKFKLNFLHLCDAAFLSQEGKLNVIGIFDIVNLKEIPGTLAKAVLVGNFSLIDTTKIDKLRLEAKIVDETGKEIQEPQIPAKDIDIPTPKPKNMGFILELGNIKFEKIGTYKFIVKINQKVLGEVTFSVKQQ